jgi:hypothetical protein
MNKKITLLAVCISPLFFSACGQISAPTIHYTEKDCAAMHRDLRNTTELIGEVERMDQVHVEEYMLAVPQPMITTSNNKPRVLKDARAHKAAVEAELQRAGCEQE